MPLSVDEAACTGCRLCEEACTVAVPDQFNGEMVSRRAAYIPFPQPIPRNALIERAGTSPCIAGCPAGIKAHGYVSLVRSGSTVLYTGMMYQLIPYIGCLVTLSSRLGDPPLARLSGLGRRANRVVNLLGLVARPSARERAEYDRILADIARLLRSAGVEFGYLYSGGLYAGALAWDMGEDEAVAAHAQRAAAVFRAEGVREVITVGPHTTTMLRNVYPSLVDGFDVRVRSYLEVLAERGLPAAASLPTEVVIHDSCVYARAENVIEAPRQLLTAAGLTVREPASSRKQTWCCGGPAEALFPAKAAAVAASQASQLRAVAPDCVPMYPICLVNLRKAGRADGTDDGA